MCAGDVTGDRDHLAEDEGAADLALVVHPAEEQGGRVSLQNAVTEKMESWTPNVYFKQFFLFACST